jgi:hypothetical protein
MDHPDNASLLTNAAALLERARADERALEIEMTILQTRLESVREVVAALTGKPRVRRQRAPRLVETPPEAPERAVQNELEGAA